jgi:hypothetical protein
VGGRRVGTGTSRTTGHVSCGIRWPCARSVVTRHPEWPQEALPGWEMEGKFGEEVAAVARQG